MTTKLQSLKTQTDIKKWTVGSPIQAPLDAIERVATVGAAVNVKISRDRRVGAIGRLEPPESTRHGAEHHRPEGCQDG